MAEYIDREKVYTIAKKICDAVHSGEYGKSTLPHSSIMLPHFILDLIDDLPAADVRPVARGKWTNKRTIEHDGEWYCTACGKEITIYMGADKEDRYNFCPNCGADMGEES